MEPTDKRLAQFAWQKKGKKYQAKYLGALKELYGRTEEEIIEAEAQNSNGETRTDCIRGLAS
jgi:hypothetical protein